MTESGSSETCSEFQWVTKTSSSEPINVDMGNGSSHSIVLGPPRFQSSDFPSRNGYQHDHRGIPKYAHPQNRVLPKPIAGQRLRSTDNGSILQTAGTIRGQRRDSGSKEEHIDSEMMDILRRRSEMIEKENDCYHQLNLRNHRLFHSDPNIARRPGPGNGYMNEDFQEAYTNRRSCGGGAANRASKLKYKKKARAPDPPPPLNSYPRRPQGSYGLDESRDRKNTNGLACKCIAKPKAPQPPAIVIHPPPPPPMPNSVTTRTKIGSPPSKSRSQNETPVRSQNENMSPPVTRAVECQGSKNTYEKNVHPLEKWRNCRSTGDIRIDEEDERPASRTTVFDSKKVPDNQSKIPSYLPQKPDPFQKEIQAVTKKIAESRQHVPSPVVRDQKTEAKPKETSSPPKFYFADPGVFKPIQKSGSTDKPVEKVSSEGFSKSDGARKDSGERKSNENTTVDEIVPSLERFSPARRRYKIPSGNTTPTPQQKAEKEWDHLSKSLFHKQEGDSDIDVRLRPVLPRKPPEVPKFSPSEAWQALGSDGMGSSNHSTSDDGPESLTAYKQNLQQRIGMNDGPRRRSDMDYDRYDRYGVDSFKHNSMSDSHWTPRQDLLDDSDVSSEDSEEAIVPRIRTGLGEISTRFSLPSVMFSNMRPIGSDLKASSTQPSFLNDSSKVKQAKRKTPKRNDPTYDNSPGPNFRRFLSKRNKYLSEEDITVSDSNWTFGQYGLQKRGKQYSSELMLSDKKKYELMVQNRFGDFLGDILVSKANHMRKQMKSSDSGNSNFSFYSTDGQIMYNPEKGGFVKEDECSPPTKGRVYDMRRRFDAIADASRPNFGLKNSKKKANASDFDLSRRRDLELAKMLEDEVRKRRNKEKISIRQQLQRMKHLQSDDEDFDDEAYFTEPKSRDDSQSPLFSPDRTAAVSELGLKQYRFGQGSSVTATDSSHLSHWQSSPALLEDSLMKTNMHPSAKGRLSLSSVMSSPDSGAWVQNNAVVDTWLQKQQKMGLDGLKKQMTSTPDGRLTASDQANDGDVSSSPTPAPPKKERRKTNIYKQLMDIVRKEERHLKKAEGEADSRDSSYSHRESSPSTCSETSSTSSYSYSDSSSAKNHSKNGVPANKEFGYRTPSAAPSFQVAFVQPYSPSKSYRPVPFDMVNSPYRLPGLQEEGKQLQAEVS